MMLQPLQRPLPAEANVAGRVLVAAAALVAAVEGRLPATPKPHRLKRPLLLLLQRRLQLHRQLRPTKPGAA
jgi:hypothetical protein